MDLRDKMDAPGEPARGGKRAFPAASEGEGAVLSDVLSALINLGYPARDAERALLDARRAAEAPGPSQGEKPVLTFERLLRDALRSVSASR